jgi:anti-sigma factor RsiW
MMGFLRNLTKSDEERRQEVLTAYLDDNLSPKDKQQFEQLLHSDESLRRDLEQQRSIKQAMAQLPRVRAPRSFTLDPSLYGRPSQQRVFNLYPAVRTATVLAMFVFIALVSIDILVPESGTVSDIASSEALAPAVEKALEEAEAPMGALAPDGIQSDRAASSEEAAPLAPVIEEAVEEIIEVESEDAVGESEDLAQSDTGAETGLDQELAAPPEELAAEREGEAEFMAPAEAEPGQGDSAIDQTRIADSIAALIVSGTPAPGDRLAGGAVETDGAVTDDTVELLPLATSTMTQLESQVPTQPVEEVVAELPSPVAEDFAKADHFQGTDSETTSDQAEELFWGLGALRIAQIILGVSVLGLVLLMLFIRQRIKREA